jgi:predicted metalloprotease
MRFNPRARIDKGRVSDSGGRGGGLPGFPGGGGGTRIPIPTGRAGGIGGLLLILLVIVLQQCVGGGIGLPGGDSGGGSQQQDTTAAGGYAECQTGADANTSEKCARKAVALSLENFWTPQFQSGFQPAKIVTFSGSVSTGCGQASAAVGPFYCPPDQQIYLDPSFFDEVLEGRLGGKGGDFVEPYVLGHEYGHHIQNVTGQMGKVRTQQGENSDAVKLELQADCYAGLWARAAESTTNDEGVQIFEDIDDQDIEEAIGAAFTVGDDHIQKTTGGRVDVDAWTHGSSEQRMESFRIGYSTDDVNACEWSRLPQS